jgi:alkylhydroperoxidase family enzyme
MLDYALHLTRTPNRIRSEHIDQLRSAGITEEEIHRIALVVAYFNFVNRVAQGLGVELEPSS